MTPTRCSTNSPSGIAIGQSDFHAACESNLKSIGDWIARDNPPRTVTLVRELRTACAALLDFPSAYPVVADLAGAPDRKRVFGAYLILYEIENAGVRILPIVHGADDPDALLGQAPSERLPGL